MSARVLVVVVVVEVPVDRVDDVLEIDVVRDVVLVRDDEVWETDVVTDVVLEEVAVKEVDVEPVCVSRRKVAVSHE